MPCNSFYNLKIFIRLLFNPGHYQMSSLKGLFEELKSSSPPQLYPYFDEFILLYDQRLWHQLTKKLELLFYNEPLATPILYILFTRFISQWEININKLVHVKLALRTAKYIPSPIDFLEDIYAKMKKENQSSKHELYILPLLEASSYRLGMVNTDSNNFDGNDLKSKEMKDGKEMEMEKKSDENKEENDQMTQVKKNIETIRNLIETNSTINPIVHAPFYKLCADYDKVSNKNKKN